MYLVAELETCINFAFRTCTQVELALSGVEEYPSSGIQTHTKHMKTKIPRLMGLGLAALAFTFVGTAFGDSGGTKEKVTASAKAQYAPGVIQGFQSDALSRSPGARALYSPAAICAIPAAGTISATTHQSKTATEVAFVIGTGCKERSISLDIPQLASQSATGAAYQSITSRASGTAKEVSFGTDSSGGAQCVLLG